MNRNNGIRQLSDEELSQVSGGEEEIVIDHFLYDSNDPTLVTTLFVRGGESFYRVSDTLTGKSTVISNISDYESAVEILRVLP